MASKVKSILRSFQSSSRSTAPEPPHPQDQFPYNGNIADTSMAIPTDAMHASMPADACPVLVELFQSQGCNSCPPTNDNLIAFIQQHESRSSSLTAPTSEPRYYARQSQSPSRPPVSSNEAPEYLLLTYQVTYWNWLGWNDTFSLPANDTRQREYVRRMGLNSAYTPMVVVNGRGVGVGNTKSDLDRILHEGTKTQVGAKMVRISKSLNEVDVNDFQVEVDATAFAPSPSHSRNPQRQLEIWEVTYTPTSQDVHIPRGENAGRTLAHLNVVKDVKRIGYLETGARGRFRVGLSSGEPWRQESLASERRVIIVQDGKGGEVLGVLKV